jgi:rubrerythrin
LPNRERARGAWDAWRHSGARSTPPERDESMIKEPTIRKAVELAVETEEVGIGFYQRIAKKFEDRPEIAETFRRLSDDEKIHAARFRKILEGAPENPPHVQSEPDRLTYLRAMSRHEMFQRGTFRKLGERVESMQDALSVALDFEKTTLNVYLGLQDVLGPHEVLDAIVEEERSHIVRIFSLLEKVSG